MHGEGKLNVQKTIDHKQIESVERLMHLLHQMQYSLTPTVQRASITLTASKAYAEDVQTSHCWQIEYEFTVTGERKRSSEGN